MRCKIIRLFYQTKFLLGEKSGYFYCKNLRKLSTQGMELKEVVKVLEDYAPQNLAADWDNVGLLLEPSNLVVNKLMLTNDLTLKVLEEAISQKTNLLVSYHPPIFKSFKRLTQDVWKERLVVACLENRIALYSPHTAWDCVNGGVNDWLIRPFNGKVEVLQPASADSKVYRVEVDVSGMGEMEGGLSDVTWKQCDGGKKYSICGAREAQLICDVIAGHDNDVKIGGYGNDPKVICQQLTAFPNKSIGFGRLVVLDKPITVKEAVEKVKSHLNLKNLQLALANHATEGTEVKTIACCAGAGSSVLRGAQADLYLTGEMSHHEILDCTNSSKGCSASVILCNHSNSERGFLEDFMKSYLSEKLSGKVLVAVSKEDRDPLQVV